MTGAWRELKEKKKHNEKFISSGLWSRSRHPNCKEQSIPEQAYNLTVSDFGESTLWTGTSLFAFSSLQAVGYYPSYAGYLAFVAPAFVTLLTQFVSGTPMLERKNDKELGSDCESNEQLHTQIRPVLIQLGQEYKARTPVFFPKIF